MEHSLEGGGAYVCIEVCCHHEVVHILSCGRVFVQLCRGHLFHQIGLARRFHSRVCWSPIHVEEVEGFIFWEGEGDVIAVARQ